MYMVLIFKVSQDTATQNSLDNISFVYIFFGLFLPLAISGYFIRQQQRNERQLWGYFLAPGLAITLSLFAPTPYLITRALKTDLF
jgi:hypothetical protein